MKSERKSTIILCIYIIIMLTVCALATQALKRSDVKDNTPIENTEDVNTDITSSVVTQIIYIPFFPESDSDTLLESNMETEIEPIEYTVKSYEEKIGIFINNNSLVRVIYVYIKTLPKADQELLEKGFLVIGESELRSIIEDYTG